MSESTVTVEFSPPRDCRSVKESWLLTADGEPDLVEYANLVTEMG